MRIQSLSTPLYQQNNNERTKTSTPSFSATKLVMTEAAAKRLVELAEGNNSIISKPEAFISELKRAFLKQTTRHEDGALRICLPEVPFRKKGDTTPLPPLNQLNYKLKAGSVFTKRIVDLFSPEEIQNGTLNEEYGEIVFDIIQQLVPKFHNVLKEAQEEYCIPAKITLNHMKEQIGAQTQSGEFLPVLTKKLDELGSPGVNYLLALVNDTQGGLNKLSKLKQKNPSLYHRIVDAFEQVYAANASIIKLPEDKLLNFLGKKEIELNVKTGFSDRALEKIEENAFKILGLNKSNPTHKTKLKTLVEPEAQIACNHLNGIAIKCPEWSPYVDKMKKQLCDLFNLQIYEKGIVSAQNPKSV